MTITNRDVFAIDPTERDIPNLGVAKVRKPEDDGDWATLEWEIHSFVCEGEYERGLERILDQFLAHISQDEQPAVWVSGFFGEREVAPDASTRVPVAGLHASVGIVRA